MHVRRRPAALASHRLPVDGVGERAAEPVPRCRLVGPDHRGGQGVKPARPADQLDDLAGDPRHPFGLEHLGIRVASVGRGEDRAGVVIDPIPRPFDARDGLRGAHAHIADRVGVMLHGVRDAPGRVVRVADLTPLEGQALRGRLRPRPGRPAGVDPLAATAIRLEGAVEVGG